MVEIRFFLHGLEIHSIPKSPWVPRKGDHIHWNDMLFEVSMVVWTKGAAVHLYLLPDKLHIPLPPGLEPPCDQSPTS